MFNELSNQFSGIINKLRGKTLLQEEDITQVMREIRIALLQADVALPVVKEFIEEVKQTLVGQEVWRTVSPGHMIVKMVHDHLEKLLGSEQTELNLAVRPPAVIMLVGLQGAGKTTASGKLALYLKSKQNKKVLLASLDVNRPAAQEQLAILATQAGVGSLPIVPGQKPVDIAERALMVAKQESYDVIFLDTAGRLHCDDELINELIEIKKRTQPVETILVADSLTGQDAVNSARTFHSHVPLTGIILTRIDGDSRGGAALSMKAVTGCPIKFLSTGEKLDALEPFHPKRIASRILDMGDIVSLVEKAVESVSQEDAEKMAKRMQRGVFDLNDLASQIKNIRKMGGLGGIMSLLPGIGRIKDQMKDAQLDESLLGRQLAIISSMTKQERKDPRILNGSRKKRIANGSGVTVQEVNKLLKQYQDMSTMMKKLSKVDKKSLMRGGIGKLFS